MLSPIFSIRYLFWLELTVLYRKHFAQTEKKRIFEYARGIAADNKGKRLYLVTVNDTIDSIDYDGGDRMELFSKPTRGIRTLAVSNDLLYCSDIYLDYVVEFNISSRNIHRFIPFVKRSYPSDVMVVNIPLEIKGKFCSVLERVNDEMIKS